MARTPGRMGCLVGQPVCIQGIRVLRLNEMFGVHERVRGGRGVRVWREVFGLSLHGCAGLPGLVCLCVGLSRGVAEPCGLV